MNTTDAVSIVESIDDVSARQSIAIGVVLRVVEEYLSLLKRLPVSADGYIIVPGETVWKPTNRGEYIPSSYLWRDDTGEWMCGTMYSMRPVCECFAIEPKDHDETSC